MKKNDKLVTFDLSKITPSGMIKEIDLRSFLERGFIFTEHTFRENLANMDLKVYKNTYINLFCPTDVIIPTWPYLILSAQFQPIAAGIFINSTKDNILTELYRLELKKYNWIQYTHKYVLIRGCKTKIPLSIYCEVVKHLHTYATKIMYGEACSNITIFRKATTK